MKEFMKVFSGGLGIMKESPAKRVYKWECMGNCPVGRKVD